MLTKQEAIREEAEDTAKNIRTIIEDTLDSVPASEFHAELRAPAFLDALADEIEAAILFHNKKP